MEDEEGEEGEEGKSETSSCPEQSKLKRLAKVTFFPPSFRDKSVKKSHRPAHDAGDHLLFTFSRTSIDHQSPKGLAKTSFSLAQRRREEPQLTASPLPERRPPQFNYFPPPAHYYYNPVLPQEFEKFAHHLSEENPHHCIVM